MMAPPVVVVLGYVTLAVILTAFAAVALVAAYVEIEHWLYRRSGGRWLHRDDPAPDETEAA